MSSNNTYQEYYKQYMQYMYSMAMYSSYSGATPTGIYNSSDGYPYTHQQLTHQPPPPPPPPPSQTISNTNNQSSLNSSSSAETSKQPHEQVNILNIENCERTETNVTNKTMQQPPAIKINLKFQQLKKLQSLENQQQSTPNVFDEVSSKKLEHAPKRKSRFDVAPKTNQSANAVTKQHVKVQNNPQQNSVVQTKSEQTVNDIVSDINKWPFKLKNYCSKVYQTYSTIKIVTEQQVTNYLRSRITEVFKDHPDLNIDWDKEKVPEMNLIRQANGIASAIPTESNKQQPALESQPKFNKITKPQNLTTQTQIYKQRRSDSRSTEVPSTIKRSRSNSDSSSGSSSTKSTSTNASSKHSTKQQKKSPNQPLIITSKLKRPDDFIRLNDDMDVMAVDENNDSYQTRKQHQINKFKARKAKK
jgi:hypothetical protein